MLVKLYSLSKLSFLRHILVKEYSGIAHIPHPQEKSRSHFKISRCNKADVKQVSYWGPTNITRRLTKCSRPGYLGLCMPVVQYVKIGHSPPTISIIVIV